ncbi:3-hydroxyacyl-CoA dehydrogenase family protein [Methylobacterium oryzae CBMB20]
MGEIAIVGGGLMGHGIALVLALHGHAVRITDTSAETRARVPGLMASALATLREAGAAPEGWDAARLARAVRVEAELGAAVTGAGLVIEAITENPEAKGALFAELDRLCPADAVLASNTSYLDVFPLIPERRQARALILHWSHAALHRRPRRRGPGARHGPGGRRRDGRPRALASGQVPIVLKRFIPGYIANRIQQAISAEVFRLLDADVAAPKDIDDAIIHGLALRIPILGHLAKADFTRAGADAAGAGQRQLRRRRRRAPAPRPSTPSAPRAGPG